MRLDAEGGILVTAPELEDRLSRELAVTDWRAVVAVVVAAPGSEKEAQQACRKAAEIAGIGESQIIVLTVRRDEVGKEQLEVMNRARDTLLQEKRIIWLQAASAADIRFLRKTAPDLTSAIDLFSELRLEVEHHPDWFTCREQICALMKARHSTLDFTGLLPATVEARRLPLAELYQPLVEPGPIAPGLEGRAPHSNSLLVLGHPGTGKSTFVRHLAWTYARQAADPLGIGSKIPLLISLSDYGYEREHDRIVSLTDFLPRWLAEQGVEHTESLATNLSEILLLLDGLDEIRAMEARRAVLVEVSQLLNEGTVGGAVVTGRSFLADEVNREGIALRVISIRAPTPDEVSEFLTKFVALRGGTEARARDLVRRVERDHDLRILARTPLMLAFMAVLDELEGRLPDRKIEIYYRLGEMLVDRWTRVRSIGTSVHRHERPTRADALCVLGPLAWWAVEQGGGAVPEEDLLQEVERIESLRETAAEAKKKALGLLEILRTDTALLVPQPGQRWGFIHNSIGEYFAGIEATRNGHHWREILSNPFPPKWREVVLFSAGQLGIIEGRVEDLNALVDAIASRSHQTDHHHHTNHVSLIIGLLETSPGLGGRQINQLVERLFELAFTKVLLYPAPLPVQHEIISFLSDARGPVTTAVATALKHWLSDSPHEIPWSRFLPDDIETELPEVTRILGTRAVDEVAAAVLDPFMYFLADGWWRRYDVDIEPTLAFWRQETDWRFRLIEWLLDNDFFARNSLFAGIAPELGLKDE